MHEYTDLAEQSKRYREDNDCAVKAIAAALNTSYGKAHRTMAKLGRKNRGCSSVAQIHMALEQITGVRIPGTSFKGEGIGKTLKRFCREHAGVYIVCTCNHAVCIRHGEMIDWTADTAGRRKITNVWKIA